MSRNRSPRTIRTRSAGVPKTRVRRGMLAPLRLRSLQQIPDAAHRLNHFLRPLIVDFASQMADINIHDVGETVVIHVPDMLDDHRAAEGPAAIPHQIFEYAELLGGKLDVFARARHLAADAIESEVAYLKTLRGRLAAAQEHAHSCQKFHEGEGLDQVIV